MRRHTRLIVLSWLCAVAPAIAQDLGGISSGGGGSSAGGSSSSETSASPTAPSAPVGVGQSNALVAGGGEGFSVTGTGAPSAAGGSSSSETSVSPTAPSAPVGGGQSSALAAGGGGGLSVTGTGAPSAAGGSPGVGNNTSLLNAASIPGGPVSTGTSGGGGGLPAGVASPMSSESSTTGGQESGGGGFAPMAGTSPVTAATSPSLAVGSQLACRRAATALPGMTMSEGQPVELYGTISALQDSQLTLTTRTGERMTIDARPAMSSGEATVLVPGRPVSILGTVDNEGNVRADVILREKGGPATWAPDCAPRGLLSNNPP